jgi:hypothetical protein
MQIRIRKRKEFRMDPRWEKIKKGLRQGAAMSIEKIEEYAKLGKLKIEEMAARRKIDRRFIDMGERIFDLLESRKGPAIADDLVVQKAIEDIKSLKEELMTIAEKVQAVVEESKRGRPARNDEELTGV